ncbi:putative serine/threonine-protein kinase, partial [Tetrabaena socialis]
MPNKCLLVFVQELCAGGSLSDALKRGLFQKKEGSRDTPEITQRMLLRTMAEICRGMHYLHSRSVVHGDLKPANVLLTQSRADRRGFTAKVADFGLARMLPDGQSRVESAATVYMSPEAFNGLHSKPSDVWSFGVLLNEAVTGQRPYANLSPAQIMLGVVCHNLRPAWPDAEWPELSALGARCLAYEPSERPTFAQLVMELVTIEEKL